MDDFNKRFEDEKYQRKYLDQAIGILKDQLEMAEKNHLQQKYKSKDDYKKYLINDYSFGCIHGVAYALIDKGSETGLFSRELDDWSALMNVSMNVLNEYYDEEYITELSSNYNIDTDNNENIDSKKYDETQHIARTEVHNALKNNTPITTWYNYLVSL